MKDKEKKVQLTIRVDEDILEELRLQAMEKRLPYQTFLNEQLYLKLKQNREDE